MNLKDLDQNVKAWLAVNTDTNKELNRKATIQRFEPNGIGQVATAKIFVICINETDATKRADILEPVEVRMVCSNALTV